MSVEQHVVVGVSKVRVNGDSWWAVAQQGPEDLPKLHVFPPQLLVHRAVEYGFDPHDSRAVLDVVLHERFLTHEESNPDAPDFVYNTDVDTARSAHLARLAGVVKTRARVSDPDGLLAPIHQEHVVDPGHLQWAHDHVKDVRRAASHRTASAASRTASSNREGVM